MTSYWRKGCSHQHDHHQSLMEIEIKTRSKHLEKAVHIAVSKILPFLCAKKSRSCRFTQVAEWIGPASAWPSLSSSSRPSLESFSQKPQTTERTTFSSASPIPAVPWFRCRRALSNDLKITLGLAKKMWRETKGLLISEVIHFIRRIVQSGS